MEIKYLFLFIHLLIIILIIKISLILLIHLKNRFETFCKTYEFLSEQNNLGNITFECENFRKIKLIIDDLIKYLEIKVRDINNENLSIFSFSKNESDFIWNVYINFNSMNFNLIYLFFFTFIMFLRG